MEPAETQAIWLSVYGRLGTTVGIMFLTAELRRVKTDRVGLIFMAMAGYDPHAAPRLFGKEWLAGKQGGLPPESFEADIPFPDADTELDDITSWIPKAMKYLSVSKVDDKEAY
ncbi:MAG: hypothetical protein U5J96_04775 [Ignavibacteriaceae bacterium]|nr:hypothetical protein [Ignavibacteriaceae bacterium]